MSDTRYCRNCMTVESAWGDDNVLLCDNHSLMAIDNAQLRERIQSIEAELTELKFQKTFEAAFADKLKEFGTVDRLIEEYSNFKMKHRALEAELRLAKELYDLEVQHSREVAGTINNTLAESQRENARLTAKLKIAVAALIRLIPSHRSPLAKCWCPHYIDVTQGHDPACIQANAALAEIEKP